MDENGESKQKDQAINPGAQRDTKNPLPTQPATQQQLRDAEQKIGEQGSP
jgi:hypothetical protein